jgi:hypothetical protein
VFDPEYKRTHNLEGYDHIQQYYFQPGEYDDNDDSGDQHQDNDPQHEEDEHL